MRGQISLEYLLISVVSLSLISISLLSLFAIRNSSMHAMNAIKFRSSAISLANTINEVCALGNGNSRSLDLASDLSVESIKADQWLVRFSSANLSLIRPTFCRVESGSNLNSQIKIKNEKGIIKVQ